MKGKNYTACRSANPVLRVVQRSVLGAFASHWLFQSMFYMDPTERVAKVVLGTVFFVIGIAALGTSVPMIILSAALAHTLNLLVDGHPWTVLKTFGLSPSSKARMERHLRRFAHRAARERSLAQVAVYGSYVRGEFHDQSDLDVRCVRRPGPLAAVRASWFAIRERATATIMGIPLDLYVFDAPHRLRKMSSAEEPHYLKRESAE